MYLFEGPDWGHSTGEGKYEKIEEEKKAQDPAAFKPSTCCLQSTTVLQSRPKMDRC